MILKILANRLALSLWNLIDNYQTVFISERNILDGFVIAQEVVHQCKKSGHDGLLLKLDFEKDYGMIDWDSLLEVLGFRGFGEK